MKLASEIDQALDELDAWTRDQGALKKHVIDEIYKLKKEVRENLLVTSLTLFQTKSGEFLQNIKKLQAQQSSACAEADKTISEYLASTSTEKSQVSFYSLLSSFGGLILLCFVQLKKKAKLTLERAGKAVKEHQKAVADANKFRMQCAVRFLPDLLAEFRSNEESRIAALKNVFGKLQTSVSSASPANPAWANLAKLILDIDPPTIGAALAQLDLSALRVPLEPVAFDAQHPDYVKSRTLRLKGTEEPVSAAPIAVSSAAPSVAVAAAPSAISSSAPAIATSNLNASGSHPVATAAVGSASLGSSEDAMHLQRNESAPHFAQVMPNTVVALGVESKREILRTQLAQLQASIIAEKRALQDLFSLVRFYGGCATATSKAKEEYAVVKKRFDNLLGARKQLFSAMERVGTTPSVLSTLRDRNRYAAAPNETVSATITTAPNRLASAPAVAASPSSAPASPAPSNLVRGYCLYSYTAATAKELSFRKGEVLIVRDEDDSGWWYVENSTGNLGFVPANFLRKLAPGENPPPAREKKKKQPVEREPSAVAFL